MIGIGDKVVYIGEGDWSCGQCVYFGENALIKGRVYTVAKVEGRGQVGTPALDLVEHPHPMSKEGWLWCSCVFRKVEPANKEFIELMNSIKPKIKETAHT